MFKLLAGNNGGKFKQYSVLPGFGLSLGYTLVYMSLIVLLPLVALGIKSSELTWDRFWQITTDPRVLASYKISFGASAIAALVNVVFGVLVAWVLVRYRFPGRRLIDAMVDLPFALPTAVAGIALTTLYAPKGWFGQYAAAWGFKIAYTPIGIVIALIFIGLPFVVRTVQPVLADLSKEIEEAAASLGATPWQRFRKIIIPELLPAILTGFAMAFARAVGEYGSVVFIAGNMPMKTEITPLMIITKLEQYQYAEATAIALVMLVISFILLLVINSLQRWLLLRSR